MVAAAPPRPASAEGLHGTPRRYKSLLFYVEACESGSVFEGLLPSNISARVVTAANPSESSWGWYCGDTSSGSNVVNGHSMSVCLGDEFSVRWLENTDNNTRSETVDDQVTAVTAAVTKSHVQDYGDASWGSDPLSDFLGTDPTSSKPQPKPRTAGGVDSRDALLRMLQFELSTLVREGGSAEATAEARRAVTAEEDARAAADAQFQHMWAALEPNKPFETRLAPRDFDCHRAAIQKGAIAYTDYSLQHHRAVVALCELGHSADAVAAAYRG